MSLELASGVSLAFVHETAVFLDLRRDRYVALAPDLSRIFQRAVKGLELTCSERSALHRPPLDRLLNYETSGFDTFTSCQVAPPAVRRSVNGITARLLPVLAAAWYRAKSSVMLRLAGPYRTTRYLSRRSRSGQRDHDPKERSKAAERSRALQVDCVLIAHARLDAAFGASDKCLPRSIALFEHLCASGVRPTLVTGVRIAPFTAHCWVQLDGAVLNDEIDNVRIFQPILVI